MNEIIEFIKSIPCLLKRHDFEILDVKIETEVWHKTRGGIRVEDSAFERTAIRRLTKCKKCGIISGNKEYEDEGVMKKANPDVLMLKYGLGFNGKNTKELLDDILKGKTL